MNGTVRLSIHRDGGWLSRMHWRESSAVVGFSRATGRREGCGRLHRHGVVHLGDGRWWDAPTDALARLVGEPDEPAALAVEALARPLRSRDDHAFDVAEGIAGC